MEAMSFAENASLNMQRARRAKDERDYRWVFWFAFPFFLAAAIVSRLRPGGETSPRPLEARQSVFRQAWVAANSSIPFAFMN